MTLECTLGPLTPDGYKSLLVHPGNTSTKAGSDLLWDEEVFRAVWTTCCYPFTRKPFWHWICRPSWLFSTKWINPGRAGPLLISCFNIDADHRVRHVRRASLQRFRPTEANPNPVRFTLGVLPISPGGPCGPGGPRSSAVSQMRQLSPFWPKRGDTGYYAEQGSRKPCSIVAVQERRRPPSATPDASSCQWLWVPDTGPALCPQHGHRWPWGPF